MKLKKMRVFLALELPAALREQLGELQGRLSFLGRGIKWVKEENMHLTLYFLGDLNTEKIQGLYSCLEDTPRLKSFKVDVSGLGYFPPRGKIRVLWAGVSTGSLKLQSLYTYLGDALQKHGFYIQRRSFIPHVTLGRFRTPMAVSSELQAGGHLQPETLYGSFVAREIALVQSVLTPAGPIYKVLRRFPI